jgi:hypothetical protein
VISAFGTSLAILRLAPKVSFGSILAVQMWCRERLQSAHLRHCLTRGEGLLTDSRAAARRRQRDRRDPARRCNFWVKL